MFVVWKGSKCDDLKQKTLKNMTMSEVQILRGGRNFVTITFSPYMFVTRPYFFSSKNTPSLDYIIQTRLSGIFGLHNPEFALPKILKRHWFIYIILMEKT